MDDHNIICAISRDIDQVQLERAKCGGWQRDHFKFWECCARSWNRKFGAVVSTFTKLPLHAFVERVTLAVPTSIERSARHSTRLRAAARSVILLADAVVATVPRRTILWAHAISAAGALLPAIGALFSRTTAQQNGCGK
jgi:hypothetical protein